MATVEQKEELALAMLRAGAKLGHITRATGLRFKALQRLRDSARNDLSLPPLQLSDDRHRELFRVYELRGPWSRQSWDSFLDEIVDNFLGNNDPDRIPRYDVVEVSKTPAPVTRTDYYYHRGARLTQQDEKRMCKQYADGDSPDLIAKRWNLKSTTVRRKLGLNDDSDRDGIRKQIALNMIDRNMPNEIIARRAKLPLIEIEHLRAARKKLVPTSLNVHSPKTDFYGMPRRENHAEGSNAGD